MPVFDTERQIYNVWMVDANGDNLRLVVENAQLAGAERRRHTVGIPALAALTTAGL